MEATSTWSSAGPVVCTAHAIDGGKADALQLVEAVSLDRPGDDSPCVLTLAFSEARSVQSLALTSSARHAEVYVGVINAKKEREFKYVETVRGVRSTADKDLYEVSATFPRSELYQEVVALEVKFLSIQPPATKHILRLQALDVRAALARSGPVAPAPSIPASSLTMLLQVQTAMQAQMEAKIFSAIDAKLGQLTLRLQSSEALVQRLAHQVTENQDTMALTKVMDRLSHLERDLAALKQLHPPLDPKPAKEIGEVAAAEDLAPVMTGES
ncbi:hypothetical protein ACHHYP_03096 [Achlya hypogyna]|uniref:Uncharacterized protein n=1 Tax=Achlya hypogyna TaxID=1202772 RepID=A0A1V9Z4P8_ACHHY|nr:hypothetical protein ACHHYP_03096 [Achlya hypogyna]